jgi:membrane protease YdiL (CAAX protease family)
VNFSGFRELSKSFFEQNRWFTFAELIIALIILTAVEFSWINQFFILAFVLYAWLSLWLRGKRWSDFGMKKPDSWKKTLLLAIMVGIVFQAFSLYTIEPLLGKLTGDIPDVSIFRPLVGDLQQLLIWLVLSWTFAAFIEEMIYRGYLMHRIADLFKQSISGWIIGLIISNLLFGFGHLYQGTSGMIATGLTGFVFAGLFFASKKNLWAAIIAHGIYDTVGFLMIFFGVYPGI